jgi:hypothetical protein
MPFEYTENQLYELETSRITKGLIENRIRYLEQEIQNVKELTDCKTDDYEFELKFLKGLVS